MATAADKEGPGPGARRGGREPAAEGAPARRTSGAGDAVTAVDGNEGSDGAVAPVAFKRRFFLPGVVLTGLELLLIVWPAIALFLPNPEERGIVLRVSAPVIGGALVLWYGVVATWLSPLQRAVQLRRRGRPIPEAIERSAYRATWNLPLRALILRTALWMAIAVAHGVVLVRYSRWEVQQVSQLAALVGLHAFVVNLVRATWYARLLGSVRTRLFPSLTPLRGFADGYFARLLTTALLVAGGAVASTSAFIYYFVPTTPAQYLQLQTFFPVAVALGFVAWLLYARASRRDIDAYLREQAEGPYGERPAGVAGAAGDARATTVYRHAQSLPYRLAAMSVIVWSLAACALAYVARREIRLELDDAILILGTTLVIAIGASLYQALWHRETIRPLLGHLTQRHRLPIRGIRTALSLRAKLLLSFGGVVLFACGMALIWGFIQYKNLVTNFSSRQAGLGLAWLRSEVAREAAASVEQPTPALVAVVLAEAAAKTRGDEAVYYYVPTDVHAKAVIVGGGRMGAPRLPWYARARLRLPHDGALELESIEMRGRHGPLRVTWHDVEHDLGGIAVLYPSYRGRGPSLERPLKELLLFFLVLFSACGGIVLLTAAEFIKPIRMLEQRADGMARGELAQPVTSGGEGDEIGRLTFALEEMRRALRDKLRSTEEVNLDLERAVQRRTADLAKKNRELAETLEKLTRAQSQLIRAEKMASIGQLVAGIAHEINNPVNAIVNTVGPLEQALGEVASGRDPANDEVSDELRDMIRVIQRGAQRTKAIVQALHNYSRTDDDSVVEFDLNRSIDDSLELLRHLLKGGITVERNYGAVGRFRGHAGQLNQVFMNLLTNAAQALAGREGATIWVTTEEIGDHVVIGVRDNGPGIPPDILPRIFDPFFTTKDVGEGTGLGLAIANGIIERHGGSIEVDSELGAGTTFTVSLPRTTEPAARDERRPGGVAARTGGHGRPPAA